MIDYKSDKNSNEQQRHRQEQLIPASNFLNYIAENAREKLTKREWDVFFSHGIACFLLAPILHLK